MPTFRRTGPAESATGVGQGRDGPPKARLGQGHQNPAARPPAARAPVRPACGRGEHTPAKLPYTGPRRADLRTSRPAPYALRVLLPVATLCSIRTARFLACQLPQLVPPRGKGTEAHKALRTRRSCLAGACSRAHLRRPSRATAPSEEKSRRMRHSEPSRGRPPSASASTTAASAGSAAHTECCAGSATEDGRTLRRDADRARLGLRGRIDIDGPDQRAG
jgi:hypothetical protein